jgi:hypothetical protein
MAPLIAALAMAGLLAFGEHLAGVVVALMFAGGKGLKAFAERRARRASFSHGIQIFAAVCRVGPQIGHAPDQLCPRSWRRVECRWYACGEARRSGSRHCCGRGR